MLLRLSYFSRSLVSRSPDEVDAFLGPARENNRASGITGLLLHVDGWFLQLLEGERAAVSQLYNSLVQDYRHCEVTLVEAGEIRERKFPNAAMGLITPSPQCPGRMIRFGPAGTFNPTMMSVPSVLALFDSCIGDTRLSAFS